MSQSKNVSEQWSCHSKQEKLSQQIAWIRKKISNLSQMQSQMNSLQSMMMHQQWKTNISPKQKQQKSKQWHPINYALGTSTRTQSQKASTGQNSNKKIKIYELKKKLENKTKEHKDRYVVYLNRLQKQEQIVSCIVQIDQYIRDEKNKQNQLFRFQAAINSDIAKANELTHQSRNLLNDQRAVLDLYRNQKIKKIMEIKRLKKIIKKSTENTQPDESLDQSINQQSHDQQQEDTNFRLELTSNRNTANILSRTQQNSSQILIQDDYPLTPNYVSFKKSPLQFSLSPKSSKILEENKRIRSSEDIEEELAVMDDAVSRYNKKYANLLQSLNYFRKFNKNLQAKIKHISITLEIYRKKLEHLVKKNQEECMQMLENISKCQTIYEKLRQREGQRGKIRGKLGMKVQNTRIIAIVNEEIGLDAQILKQKIPKLQSLSTQIQQIVKRVIGVEELVSQNLQRVH